MVTQELAASKAGTGVISTHGLVPGAWTVLVQANYHYVDGRRVCRCIRPTKYVLVTIRQPIHTRSDSNRYLSLDDNYSSRYYRLLEIYSSRLQYKNDTGAITQATFSVLHGSKFCYILS